MVVGVLNFMSIYTVLIKSGLQKVTHYCRCINNLWSLRKNCEVWTPTKFKSTGNRQLQNPITSRVSWFCSGVPIVDKSRALTRIQVSSPSPTFPQSSLAENWFTDDMHMYSVRHACHHHYRTTIPTAIWFAANLAGHTDFHPIQTVNEYTPIAVGLSPQPTGGLFPDLYITPLTFTCPKWG